MELANYIETAMKSILKNPIYEVLSEIKITKILKQSNFVKREVGYPPFQIILHFLYMLIMQKRQSTFIKNSDKAYGKDVYYRFIKEKRYNWRKLLLLSATEILKKITNKIYYKTELDLLELGELTLYYKKNYQTKNGIVIPPLSTLKSFSIREYRYIKEIYKKLHLQNDSFVSLSDKEKSYLSKHKTITVQNEDSWSPYNYNKNNTPHGFSIDYINLLAKKLNIEVEYIQGYDWGEFLQMIKDEKIDVLVNIVKNKDREKYINFTTPYLESKKAIFSNIANIKNISDLRGKVVALPKQFNIQNYLNNNYPDIKIKTFKSTKECLYALINKEADAMIENYAVVNSLMKKDGLSIPYVTISDDAILTSDLRIGVRKSQTLLRDILEKAKEAVSEEEFLELEQKWFHTKNDEETNFTQQELEYIKNKKSIKVCASKNISPSVIFKKDEITGISIEFLRHITDVSNLNFEIVPSKDIEEHFKMIKNGVCDISPLIVTNPNVHDFLLTTTPIMSDTIVLATKINEPYISDMKLLELIQNKFKVKMVRRTIAKYRKQLNIAGSSERKKLYHLH